MCVLASENVTTGNEMMPLSDRDVVAGNKVTRLSDRDVIARNEVAQVPYMDVIASEARQSHIKMPLRARRDNPRFYIA